MRHRHASQPYRRPAHEDAIRLITRLLDKDPDTRPTIQAALALIDAPQASTVKATRIDHLGPASATKAAEPERPQSGAFLRVAEVNVTTSLRNYALTVEHHTGDATREHYYGYVVNFCKEVDSTPAE